MGPSHTGDASNQFGQLSNQDLFSTDTALTEAGRFANADADWALPDLRG